MCLQVRETETWMPPKAGQSQDDLESSGDFIFTYEDSTTFDDEDNYKDTEDYGDMSGSGDDKPSVDEDSVTTDVSQYAAYKNIKTNKIAEQA